MDAAFSRTLVLKCSPAWLIGVQCVFCCCSTLLKGLYKDWWGCVVPALYQPKQRQHSSWRLRYINVWPVSDWIRNTVGAESYLAGSPSVGHQALWTRLAMLAFDGVNAGIIQLSGFAAVFICAPGTLSMIWALHWNQTGLKGGKV
jgi:hypothetical protein